MIRTQVYIPEKILFRLEQIAKKKKIKVATLIRNYLIAGIKKDFKPVDLTPLIKLGITGGPKDLSKNMDKYLYGD